MGLAAREARRLAKSRGAIEKQRGLVIPGVLPGSSWGCAPRRAPPGIHDFARIARLSSCPRSRTRPSRPARLLRAGGTASLIPAPSHGSGQRICRLRPRARSRGYSRPRLGSSRPFGTMAAQKSLLDMKRNDHHYGKTVLEYLACTRTAAATILCLFTIMPTLSRAQTPTATPLIYPSPTPTTTATPTKVNMSYGDPTSFTPRPYDLHIPPGQPSPTPIRSIDQPPSGDPQFGETLQWAAYAPPPGTPGPDGTTGHWPAIVVFHNGGYKNGDY